MNLTSNVVHVYGNHYSASDGLDERMDLYVAALGQPAVPSTVARPSQRVADIVKQYFDAVNGLVAEWDGAMDPGLRLRELSVVYGCNLAAELFGTDSLAHFANVCAEADVVSIVGPPYISSIPWHILPISQASTPQLLIDRSWAFRAGSVRGSAYPLLASELNGERRLGVRLRGVQPSRCARLRFVEVASIDQFSATIREHDVVVLLSRSYDGGDIDADGDHLILAKKAASPKASATATRHAYVLYGPMEARSYCFPPGALVLLLSCNSPYPKQQYSRHATADSIVQASQATVVSATARIPEREVPRILQTFLDCLVESGSHTLAVRLNKWRASLGPLGLLFVVHGSWSRRVTHK